MAVKNTKNPFNQRSSLLTAFLLLIFVCIGAKLFNLQIIHGQQARQQADAQHSIYKKLFPSRGEIKLADKQSSETAALATNLKSFLVYAVPAEIINPELTSAGLAAVLQMETGEILDKITKTDKKYVPIKKRLTELEQEKIKELKFSGIFFDSEDTRFYPENSLLSQTLGFVGYKNGSDQKIGLYGLERYFNSDLAGQSGELVSEKDTGGALIFGTKSEGQPAIDGMDLILTVDKTIQFQAESIIKETVTKHGADSGSVIVANPKTGAILAMANYPNFDPNQYNKVTDPFLFNNESVTGNYEPGSVFKAITMAAAVNEDKVTPDTTYNDTGSITIDTYTIKNSDNVAHGKQTMTQVLDESLNTGAIFAKDQIGNESFFQYLKNFGFGLPTGIELPEAKGSLDGLKANIKVDYATASFGQGISVTPIQLVQAYTALANGGKMMKPYIVQTKIDPEGQTYNIKPEFVREVISERAANIISAMLVSVVENGHGKKASVPGYFIAGKTGTAQVAKKDGKGYEENYNIGSFIGFGPVEDPQFVMLVRVNHPRDVQFAETTAAPAWGQMAQFILNYYHVAPTRNINK